jgi:hypothetical protein
MEFTPYNVARSCLADKRLRFELPQASDIHAIDEAARDHVVIARCLAN